jgi:pyrimidine operon attenuation protein/uracil phosphoribosyltransferase
MKNFKTQIMDADAIERSVRRIAHEIVEKNKGCENLLLVGIKSRGVPLAEKICKNIEKIEGVKVPLDTVDIRQFRDDLEEKSKEESLKKPELSFSVTDKTIILVDDVLYTGRTVRAAIEAIFSIGRPRAIQLAILIDRGHRQLPFRADYIGKNIPTSNEERVSVCIAPFDDINGVYIK